MACPSERVCVTSVFPTTRPVQKSFTRSPGVPDHDHAGHETLVLARPLLLRIRLLRQFLLRMLLSPKIVRVFALVRIAEEALHPLH